MAQVAVIIPTYNRRAVTLKCIANILNGTFTDITIVVCDSDSSDGTQVAVNAIKDIVLLDVGKDSWWTAAVNFGINWALQSNYKYVLVINDDIDVPSTLIEKLLADAVITKNKIISPAQISDDGIFLGMTYSRYLKIAQPVSNITNNKLIDVDSTNGCCLFIPSIIFQHVGVFDSKNCPHLAGDIEFQIRAKRHGFSTVVSPSVIIRQHARTDYYKDLTFRKLLSSKGSPAYFNAYIQLGRTLFDGSIKFSLFGIHYHYRYLRGFIKALLVSMKII